MHIPIYPVEAIDDAKPDYILILPWNLKDEIVQQMCHVGKWSARFIVPIPSVSIVNPKELSSLRAAPFPCGRLARGFDARLTRGVALPPLLSR